MNVASGQLSVVSGSWKTHPARRRRDGAPAELGHPPTLW